MELGQWMEITGQFVKVKQRRKTEWKRIEFPNPVKAMVIGRRTVFDGDKIENWDGDATWYEFKQAKPHNVYLFVQNMRENPIYVLPSDVVWERE
jgi:hypothetical protein